MKSLRTLQWGKAFGVALVGLGLTTQGLAATASETHTRVWRGWAPQDVLVQQLNGELIPFVTGLGAEGLEDFVVALPWRPDTLKEIREAGWSVPDAFSLYDFSSLKAYEDFMNSPHGEQLDRLHDGAFPDSRSHWVEVQKFRGKLMVDRAYQVLGKPVDWNEGEVRISLHLAKAGVARKVYLGQLNLYTVALPHLYESVGLRAHVLLVGDRYWVEFAQFDNGKSASALQNPIHRFKAPIEERKWILPGRRTGEEVDYGSAAILEIQ